MRELVPKLSLPVRLALLVAGTTLPLIIFATVIVFNNYEQDRQDASQRVVETVRNIRLVLDAEVQRMTGALQVLALTNALRDRDFDGFRRIAQGFLDQYGEGGVVLVADREGRQLFSSITQQPRDRGESVRDKKPAVLKSVLRRGEKADDHDRRGSGASRWRGAPCYFLQSADRHL